MCDYCNKIKSAVLHKIANENDWLNWKSGSSCTWSPYTVEDSMLANYQYCPKCGQQIHL